MLANTPTDVCVGQLDADVHLPGTARLALLQFIEDELPKWRDHPERPQAAAETTLTEHLCDHLNTATYYSKTWSHIQFRTETGDEVKRGRKIDLTVKPRAAVITIEGRRHTQFDSLLPIECKRLPTPSDGDRDEREYVITRSGSTGGIQRFKFGHHASAKSFAAMIGYVQGQSIKHWHTRVNDWIGELSKTSGSLWSKADYLHALSECSAKKTCSFRSSHKRSGEIGVCELVHVWIEMN